MSLFVVIRSPSKRRTLLSVLGGSVFLVAALCCLALWLPTTNDGNVIDRGMRTAADQSDHPTTPATPPIRLQVSSVESALQFEWDSSGDPDTTDVELSRFLKVEWLVAEELAKQAASATLEIQDGEQILQFAIEPAQLPNGLRTYFPASNDIRFEMTIELHQGSEEVAIARFVSASRPDSDPGGSSPDESGGSDARHLPQPPVSEHQEEAAVPMLASQSDRKFSPTPSPRESEAIEITESTESAGARAQGVLLMQKGPAAPPESEDSPARE